MILEPCTPTFFTAYSPVTSQNAFSKASAMGPILKCVSAYLLAFADSQRRVVSAGWMRLVKYRLGLAGRVYRVLHLPRSSEAGTACRFALLEAGTFRRGRNHARSQLADRGECGQRSRWGSTLLLSRARRWDRGHHAPGSQRARRGSCVIRIQCDRLGNRRGRVGAEQPVGESEPARPARHQRERQCSQGLVEKCCTHAAQCS